MPNETTIPALPIVHNHLNPTEKLSLSTDLKASPTIPSGFQQGRKFIDFTPLQDEIEKLLLKFDKGRKERHQEVVKLYKDYLKSCSERSASNLQDKKILSLQGVMVGLQVFSAIANVSPQSVVNLTDKVNIFSRFFFKQDVLDLARFYTPSTNQLDLNEVSKWFSSVMQPITGAFQSASAILQPLNQATSTEDQSRTSIAQTDYSSLCNKETTQSEGHSKIINDLKELRNKQFETLRAMVR